MTQLPHTRDPGPLVLAAFVVILAGSGAARAAEPMKMDHATMAPAAAAPGGDHAADKAYAAANDAMMTGMDVKPTGDPDRDFAAMMLPHHQGAVEMAKVEIQYGHDPMLRKLAADIIKAQAIEIAQMQGWQKRHAR